MITPCAGSSPQRGLHRCLLVVAWFFFILLTINIRVGCASDERLSEGLIRELRGGVAAHDVDGLWSGESYEDGPAILAGLVFNRPLFHLLSGVAYPEVGGSINARGDTSKIFGGLLLQWEPAESFYFATGFGLALHNGELDTNRPNRKSLGSRVLFRIPIEIGITFDRHHRFMVVFDHVSNADLATPNEGLDTLGVMYGYRF